MLTSSNAINKYLFKRFINLKFTNIRLTFKIIRFSISFAEMDKIRGLNQTRQKYLRHDQNHSSKCLESGLFAMLTRIPSNNSLIIFLNNISRTFLNAMTVEITVITND